MWTGSHSEFTGLSSIGATYSIAFRDTVTMSEYSVVLVQHTAKLNTGNLLLLHLTAI